MKSTKRTVVVFFDAPAVDGYPFDTPEYVRSYKDFAALLQRRGGELLVARGMDTYEGKMRFASGWRYEDNGQLIPVSGIKADVIYNKGHFIADAGAFVLNDPALDALCTDKVATQKLLPEISPRTVLLTTHDDLPKLTDLGAKIVVKPVDDEGGAGVFIGETHDVAQKIPSLPYLAQSFIDTSGGIPGITDSVHDFRMLNVHGRMIQAFIRTPPPGGVLPNVAQGGSTREVELEDVPEGAKKIFEFVDARLSQYENRVYSVDIGLDADGTWRLFELNSRPALFSRERGPGFVRFHEALADVLLSDPS